MHGTKEGYNVGAIETESVADSEWTRITNFFMSCVQVRRFRANNCNVWRGKILFEAFRFEV